MSTVQLQRRNDLEGRLLAFATTVCKLSGKLLRTQPGRHICDQLMRSSTGAAANYAEARGGESNRDFIHKLKLTLKELREALFWLSLVSNLELVTESQMDRTHQEANELISIFVVSISTARRHSPT